MRIAVADVKGLPQQTQLFPLIRKKSRKRRFRSKSSRRTDRSPHNLPPQMPEEFFRHAKEAQVGLVAAVDGAFAVGAG